MRIVAAFSLVPGTKLSCEASVKAAPIALKFTTCVMGNLIIVVSKERPKLAQVHGPLAPFAFCCLLNGTDEAIWFHDFVTRATSLCQKGCTRHDAVRRVAIWNQREHLSQVCGRDASAQECLREGSPGLVLEDPDTYITPHALQLLCWHPLPSPKTYFEC